MMLLNGLKRMYIVDFNMFLNEKYGTSDVSRSWTSILKTHIESGFDESGRIIINGYDYPEQYENFSVDYFVIDLNNKYVGYNDEYSGYDKDGNYVVVLYITKPYINNQGLLNTALNHELKHAYQDYMRQTSGGVPINSSKESLEIYTKDFIRLLSSNEHGGGVKEVLRMYYYTSDLEYPAYLENIKDGYNEYLNVINSIINKDFSIYLKDYIDLEDNFNDIKTNFNIPYLNKFNSGSSFVSRSSNKLKVKAEKIKKRIHKLLYGNK